MAGSLANSHQHFIRRDEPSGDRQRGGHGHDRSSWSGGAEQIRIDGALKFSHFQQQAKPRIGTPRGERLVDQTAVTIGTTVTYTLHRYLAAGVFAELDRTTRRAGELVGFDADGRATIDSAIGGKSTELWTGLVVRGEWRWLFADLGYGLVTRRWATGRDDLPAAESVWIVAVFDRTIPVFGQMIPNTVDVIASDPHAITQPLPPALPAGSALGYEYSQFLIGID